jgi:ferrous iron transport protein B
MRILLVGNPNVGKSVVFSRLTGVEVMCSNYPGTTVSYCSGSIRYKNESVELVDTPGTYSLEPRSKVEEVTVEMVDGGDVIINVVDATNLERNLYLTLELLERGKPMMVALNMWDEAKHLGVEINVQKLERLLGVPVIPTVAVTGQGVSELVSRIPEAKAPEGRKLAEDERWARVGEITGAVQVVRHRHHTLGDRLAEATIKPLTGLPIAAFILFFMFTAIVSAGNWFIGSVLDPFFYKLYDPFIRSVVESVFPSGIAHDILLGRGRDFTASLGVLTTGVYVPLDMILPFVILFYFTLSLLEDVGYLPRLATLLDNVMHKIGLHGSAIVPTVLGLGCRVPGVIATRIMETKKQRFITATLIAICIPCLAQNAVIVGILLKYGVNYVALVYAILAVLYVCVGTILNRLVGGESPEILLEIPPYRMPTRNILTKTWVRVKHFIYDAVPYILLGVLAVNLMNLAGIIGAVTRLFGPALTSWFGLPSEAVIALLVGFLRKDFAVGMLAPLNLNPMQLVVASTLLTIYFPCIATLTVLWKELGTKDMAKALAVMFAVTIVVGGILNFLLL